MLQEFFIPEYFLGKGNGIAAVRHGLVGDQRGDAVDEAPAEEHKLVLPGIPVGIGLPVALHRLVEGGEGMSALEVRVLGAQLYLPFSAPGR